jgi:phosphoenolpyruvate hydrolase-like protein
MLLPCGVCVCLFVCRWFCIVEYVCVCVCVCVCVGVGVWVWVPPCVCVHVCVGSFLLGGVFSCGNYFCWALQLLNSVLKSCDCCLGHNLSRTLELSFLSSSLLVLVWQGSIGASTVFTLAESAQRVQAICDAAKQVNPDVLVLCHGGPISMPDDAAYILRNTHGVHGFYGASSAERLPTEVAITKQLEAFKAISL